jgi:hypothetical protein
LAKQIVLGDNADEVAWRVNHWRAADFVLEHQLGRGAIGYDFIATALRTMTDSVD